MSRVRPCRRRVTVLLATVVRGLLDLHYSIEVHNEPGEIIHSLAFDDALEVVTPR